MSRQIVRDRYQALPDIIKMVSDGRQKMAGRDNRLIGWSGQPRKVATGPNRRMLARSGDAGGADK